MAINTISRHMQGISMPTAILGETLSFLGLNDLTTAETICHTWLTCIKSTLQWKKQCQNMLGLSSDIDPKEYFPKNLSYKEGVKLIFPRFFGRSIWQRYIGDVGSVSPIPKRISFANWNDPDPCDPTTTIGKEYVWMYCPSYIETELEGFSLSEPDDPASEAPKLIKKPGSKVSKVFVTINNVGKLFERPKAGHSSKYNFCDLVIEQHGNKRIRAEWICMRRNVIGKSLSFDNQEELAKEKGVVIAQLLHRIVFNFLEHARTNAYPDEQNSYTVVRTSTHVRDIEGHDWSTTCTAYNTSTLFVTYSFDFMGVTEAFPVKIQPLTS